MGQGNCQKQVPGYKKNSYGQNLIITDLLRSFSFSAQWAIIDVIELESWKYFVLFSIKVCSQ